MMPGVFLLYVALVAATLYPRGTEPLTYHPAATLAGAAALALAAYAAHRKAATSFLRTRATAPRLAARRLSRAGTLGALLLIAGHVALVYLGHWPLLVEETLDRALPVSGTGTGIDVVDTGLRFVLTALYLAVVLMPLLLATAASWLAIHPAERAVRGGDLPLGAFLRFRAQTLAAFGLFPPLVLYALFNALAGVPLWQRELEVYPFLVWAGMTVLFLALFALFPLLLRLGFRARPVPPGPLRDRLDACCARAGFRCRNLLVWNTCGTRALNAFIAGLTPRLRYVFFTDALLDRLSPEEVEAVLAHEIGHAACRHLRWYGILTVGFVALTATVTTWESRLFGEALLPQVLAEGLLLVGYFGGVLGYLSRRFETEADLYAARLLGDALRFAAALRKVLHLSGTPALRGSWRHPSPARRLAFLAGVARFPLIETRFLAGLRRLTLAAGVLVLASLAGAWQTAARDLEEAPAQREKLEQRDQALALWQEADALDRSGSHDEAVARLRDACRRLPDEPSLFKALGVALDHARRPEEARAAYAESERLGPKGLRLRQFLAERLEGAPRAEGDPARTP